MKIGSTTRIKQLISKDTFKSIAITPLMFYPIRNYETFCKYLKFVNHPYKDDPEKVFYQTGGVMKEIRDYQKGDNSRRIEKIKRNMTNRYFLTTLAMMYLLQGEKATLLYFKQIRIEELTAYMTKKFNITDDLYLNMFFEWADKGYIYYDQGYEGYVTFLCEEDYHHMKKFLTTPENDITFWSAYLLFGGWLNESAAVHIQKYLFHQMCLDDGKRDSLGFNLRFDNEVCEFLFC